jgi:hypothetical protein
MTNMTSFSKRPSEMTDIELNEQTLSFRDRLMLKSDQAKIYIKTFTKYEEKEMLLENKLRNGDKKKSVRLPYAESSEYKHRV